MNKKDFKILHILPAFHYDVAYRKTYKEYLDTSLDIIKKALVLLQKNNDFTFCIEQVILLREYVNRYPRSLEKIRKYAKENRLIFAPGMFTMPDSNIPSGENFIRNTLLGRKWLSENVGVTPDCCWMADIFGHNSQSPQLAKTCGYSSYMFERGMNGSWDVTFLWKGIDGSTIPTQWEIDTYYGITLAVAWLDSRPLQWVEDRLNNIVIEPLIKNSPSEFLFSTCGGDFFKPSSKYIDFVRNWNNANKKVKIVFSSPSKYFRTIKENKVSLKINNNELNPLMQGCYSSRIRIKQFNRRLEEHLAALELLECIIASGHQTSEKIWESVNWNAFHDIICGTLEKNAVKEAIDKYERAEKKILYEIRLKLGKISSSIFEGASENNNGALLFNSLPYKRIEIININGSGTFKRIELPPSGFAPVNFHPENSNYTNTVKIRHNGYLMENSNLKIIFGENGTITSLFDKHNKYEYAIPSNGMNNIFIEPDYGDLWNYYHGPVNGSLLRTTPLYNPQPNSGISILREGHIASKSIDANCLIWPQPEIIYNHPLQGTICFNYKNISLKTEISLRADEKIIRFRTAFIPKGKKYRLRVAFPTAIKNGKIRHSIPCGHIERPEGEYPAQNWIDYSETKKGILLINKGLPGNNITQNVIMLSLFRAVSMENIENKPWYEEGIEHIFEYALMPFNPADKNYNPARDAAVFNREIYSIPIKCSTQIPPEAKSLIELKSDSVELSCIKKDNDFLIIRIWETKGKMGQVKLKINLKILSCVKTDAVGTVLEEVNFSKDLIIANIRPFEIMTLQVKCHYEDL